MPILHEPARPCRAVILAAGRGSRLAREGSLPKPLTPLNGCRIIDYTLEAVATAGVREVLLVTGHREPDVREALGSRGPQGLPISYVSNPHWDGPASTSLRAARAWCGDEPFLLLMSDHVLSPAFVRRFLHRAVPGTSCVASDTAPRDAAYVAESTLLDFDTGRRVSGIGKGRETWQALDAGAFILQPSAWPIVEAAPERCELSVIMTLLAATPEGLHAVDITGEFWYDIDTAADLAAATAALKASAAALAATAL